MCWTEFCTSAKSMLGVILHVHESPDIPRYRRAWWDRGYPIGGVQFLLSLNSWMHLSYAVEEGGLREELGSRDALGTPSGLDREHGGWTVYPKLFLGICKLTPGLPFPRWRNRLRDNTPPT